VGGETLMHARDLRVAEVFGNEGWPWGTKRFRVAGVDPRLVEGIDKIDAGFALFDEHLRLLFCNVRYPQIRGYAIEVDLDILIERLLVSPKSPCPCSKVQ
jgi:hypothetical protein